MPEKRNRIEERSLRVWKVLLGKALTKDKIVYRDLASCANIPQPTLIGAGPRTILGRVHQYCVREGLPPLDVLVIDLEHREPSAGYPGDFVEDTRAVFGFDWFAVSCPTSNDFL